jgi:hypothetical protein
VKSNTFRLRGIAFAYLFGPPRELGRPEGSKIHDAICQELRLDDFSFQFTRQEEAPRSTGFRIQMGRLEGRGGLEVLVEGKGVQTPLRFLVHQVWPQSSEVAAQQTEMVTSAFWKGLGGEGWQVVLAEVRLQAQCGSGEPKAIDWFRKHALPFGDERFSRLGGQVSFADVKLEVLPPVGEIDFWSSARREISLQVLREDPRDVYLDVVSTWSGLRAVPGAQGLMVQVAGPDQRLPEASPGEYIRQTMEYTRTRVLNLVPEGDEE